LIVDIALVESAATTIRILDPKGIDNSVGGFLNVSEAFEQQLGIALVQADVILSSSCGLQLDCRTQKRTQPPPPPFLVVAVASEISRDGAKSRESAHVLSRDLRPSPSAHDFRTKPLVIKT
jgi:hypothetical protein